MGTSNSVSTYTMVTPIKFSLLGTRTTILSIMPVRNLGTTVNFLHSRFQAQRSLNSPSKKTVMQCFSPCPMSLFGYTHTHTHTHIHIHTHIILTYNVVYNVYAAAAAAAAASLQSCPTLCNPIDGSPPASPVPGILQARTLKWVAISFSNA